MEPPATRPSFGLVFSFIAVSMLASVGHLLLSGKIILEDMNQPLYFGSCILHQLQALPLPSMRSILLLIGLCSASYLQSTSVNQYITTESPIAKERLLANISPSGAKCLGAKVSVSCQTGFLAPHQLSL